MRIIDLENINYAMRNETQFVLHCEEVFHDKVSAAAAAILTGGRDKRIVALTRCRARTTASSSPRASTCSIR